MPYLFLSDSIEVTNNNRKLYAGWEPGITEGIVVSPFGKAHKGPSIEDVGKFSRFLTPIPLRRRFFGAIRRQIWPIFDPSP